MKRACVYCGFKSIEATMLPGNDGWRCKAMNPCWKRMCKRIVAMRLIAKQMANVCHNLGKQQGHVLTKDNCELLRDLAKEWDSI